MNITDRQLAILHHTLGLEPTKRTPYRNHYMAGPGHYAQPDLDALESAGLMRHGRAPSFCAADDVLYCCTETGQAYAIDNLPEPPKRTRYQQFMDDDFGHSFAEWLGIEVPKYEWRDYFTRERAVRMVSPRATGEWKSTQKDAKASYKLALKSSNPHGWRYA